MAPDSFEFLDRAIQAARGADTTSDAAGRLLSRYVPDGPGRDAPADAWATWLGENRRYLFFSDVGWYRWYVDPLAKRRGVPTSRLRGPDRASR